MSDKIKEKKEKKVLVRFPDHTGDTEKEMTVQELKENHSHCMLVDPATRNAVTTKEIETLDLREVVCFPAIRGG